MAKNNALKGVYGISIEERDKQLSRNLEKYPLYTEELTPGIGEMTTIDDGKNKPTDMGKGGLLGHTVSNKDAYGKSLNEFYDRNVDNLEIYQTPASENKVSHLYDSSYDYSEYMKELNHLSWDKDFINKLAAWDESLADISGALNFTIGDGSQSIFQTLFDNKTYGSMTLALEPTRIGIVRNFSVADAVNGGIITDINNWSGKDTKLGTYTSTIVGKALQYASEFNTIRNAKYITPELSKVYGLNTYTVHNFSYLLSVDDSTGEMNSIEDGEYIKPIDELYADAYNSYDEVDDRQQDYIRYKNVFAYASDETTKENGKDYIKNVPTRHKQYNPFTPYTSNELTNGFSVDSHIVKFGNETRSKNNEYFFSEPDGSSIPSSISGLDIYDVTVKTYDSTESLTGDGSSLLEKTEKLYRDNKIASLAARFHTSLQTDPTATANTLTQSAVDPTYGMSRGRNLLTKGAYEGTSTVRDNGYENPYCRVWTYHHQYQTYKDAIRPFVDNDNPVSAGDLQKNWDVNMRTDEAARRLNDYGVLNKNGLVNIAPTNGTDGVDIKKCMFSIENLAWKDVNKRAYMNDVDRILSPEQIGPNGGRIMWFPPYDLTFGENVSADWEPQNFIGRGENIYTYKNTSRTGQLDFSILVDHPSIVDTWGLGSSSDKKESDEQTLLRFFAGCEQIEPRTRTKAQKQAKEEETKTERLVKKVDEAISTKEFKFNVYFPNDCSGRRLSEVSKTQDQLIDYLLFGHDFITITENTTTDKYLYDFEVDENDASSYRGYEMLGDVDGTPDKVYGFKTSGVTSGVKEDTVCKATDCGYYQDNRGCKKDGSGKHADMGSAMLNRELTFIKDERFGNLTKKKAAPDYTLTDVFLALGCGSETQKNYLNSIISDEAKERVKTLTNLLNDKNVKISSVTVRGFASYRNEKNKEKKGSENNTALYTNRGETIKQWLQKNSKFYGVSITADIGETEKGTVDTKKEAYESAYIEKRSRRTEVTVEYTLSTEGEVREENSSQPANSRTAAVVANQAAKETDLTKVLAGVSKTDEFINTVPQKTADVISEAVMGTRKTTNTTVTPNSYRYDYEKTYFTNIEAKDPLTYSKIVDKIKYFSPAFHSITPEGFNARLTFLHQCTRQGHTIGATSASSGWGNSAGNLAFGRPPVCVLRLGDFYNTKIVITSMNITYDDGGIQWDQNPEGIGLQPMRAKVSLSITFLGGSDIAGPVARLQNAVSFNYYANTSLYDNRSDVMEAGTGENGPRISSSWIPTPKTYK